jgi:AraC-like DNA-binding protein
MKSINLLTHAVTESSLGRVLMAGSISNSRGVSFQNMRILGSYAIVLLTAGSGRYADANGRSEVIAPGDVIIVTPDIAHAYGPGTGEHWDEVYIVFGGQIFNVWANELKRIGPVVHGGIVTLWQQRLYDIAAASSNLMQMSLVQLFLANLDENPPTQHKIVVDWFKDAKILLCGPALNAAHDPKAVARTLGIGHETFRKTFRQLAGVSPGRFREAAVMQQACNLLLSPEYTLENIAQKTGHCDAFHFSKRFRQIVGLSPSAYRQQAGVYPLR